MYEALPSTEKCNVNRRSIRHSMTQNSSRGSSILTNGSPDKTAAVAQSSGPMLAVAVALKKFVGRLLSQSTPCDDTSIPQGCFDLLFYANLFLPLPHREPGEAIWHRGLALQAASFMNTRYPTTH